MKSTFLSSVFAACVLATLLKLGAVSASPIPQLNTDFNDVLIPRVGPEVDVRPSLVQSDLASRSDDFVHGELFRRAENESKGSSQGPVRADAATASGGQKSHTGRPPDAGRIMY